MFAILALVGALACGRTELDLAGDTASLGPNYGAAGAISGAGGTSHGAAGVISGAAGVTSGAAGATGAGAVGQDGGSGPSPDGGAPGTGGSGPSPILYTRCSTVGALDCSSQNPTVRVLCDGMTWSPVAKCPAGLVCDTSPGPNHGLCIGSEAGTSGGAGGSTPSEDPGGTGLVLYTTCTTLGDLDCRIANPKVQVLCDGMTWNPIGTCTGQLVCDPKPGPNQGLCKSP
jgi:hypothetical protein